MDYKSEKYTNRLIKFKLEPPELHRLYNNFLTVYTILRKYVYIECYNELIFDNVK